MKLKLVSINQPVADNQTNLHYKTEIVLRSRYNAYSTKIRCLVIRSITGDLSNVAIDRANLKLPKNLMLADYQFHTLPLACS